MIRNLRYTPACDGGFIPDAKSHSTTTNASSPTLMSRHARSHLPWFSFRLSRLKRLHSAKATISPAQATTSQQPPRRPPRAAAIDERSRRRWRKLLLATMDGVKVRNPASPITVPPIRAPSGEPEQARYRKLRKQRGAPDIGDTLAAIRQPCVRRQRGGISFGKYKRAPRYRYAARCRDFNGLRFAASERCGDVLGDH
jgi:hypothetical protein